MKAGRVLGYVVLGRHGLLVYFTIAQKWARMLERLRKDSDPVPAGVSVLFRL